MQIPGLVVACALLFVHGCAPPPDRPSARRRPAAEQRLTPPLKVVSVRALPNDDLVALSSDGSAAISSNAGESWGPVGPPTKLSGEIAEVDGIAQHQGELFALTPSGAFKSADRRTWTALGERSQRGTLLWTASTIWVADKRGSLDALVGLGHLSDAGVVTAVVEAGDKRLFAASFGAGVFRSEDLGRGWEQANQGLTNLDVTSLAVVSGGEVLAGVFGGGVHRSSDGRSWTQSSQGLEDSEVQALATDGKKLVLAGAQRGLMRSIDGGRSWTRSGGLIARDNVQALAVDSHGRVFAATWGNGLYRSDDGGVSFSQLWLRDDRRDLMGLAQAADGTLYIGARSGNVYSVKPNGADWRELGSPAETPVHDLVVTESGVLLAATPQAAYQRDSKPGGSWKKLEGYELRGVGGLAVGAEGELLIRSGGPSENAESLFASADRGQRFELRKDPCLKEDVDPRLSASPDGAIVMAACRCLSKDGGRSWTKLADIPAGQACKAHVGESHAVAVGSNNSSDFGVYVSTKGGAFERRAVIGVAPHCVSVNRGGEVLIVARDRVLALPPRAKQPVERARGTFECTRMLVGKDDAVVMVGSAGAYASTDGGSKWTRIDGLAKQQAGTKESKP